MKLSEIARILHCELHGDGDVEITDVAPVEDAPPGSLTFVVDRRHARELATSRAAAALLPPDAPDVTLPSLRTSEPYAAFVAAVELFHPSPAREPGVHPTAVIAATARIGDGAVIGPHVVIGDRVEIGCRAVLDAHVVVYRDVRIGEAFTAHAGVVVREGVRIGHRVTLHAGAVIGSDGFGFLPLADGHRRIPQVGGVVIEDDVEIGANTTVDRATLGATVIGHGTKIDNLVMVGHGCRIGPDCLIAAQVGLAGSTTLGARVMLGGQVGSAGHLTVGDGARVAAQSGVHRDVPPRHDYAGYPAVQAREWRRASACMPRLPALFRRMRRLEHAVGVGGAEDAPGDEG